MSEIKLSIITINLNDANGLERTIKSVLNQTYTNYQFIVIDGASTDGSVDVIKQSEAGIHYWISEPDKGIYNAMNKGIREAKGEYCFFLNAGDIFALDEVLEKIFRDDPHESFICGDYIREKNGILIEQQDYKGRTWEFALYDVFSDFLCHQAFFIRTDNFEKYGFYDERLKIMSDWKLFLDAIGVHHEKVLYKEVFISIFNVEGISHTIGGKAIYKEKLQAVQDILSPETIKKLDRLYYLQRNDFWVDFIHSKKWINFLCKCFFTICEKLRLTKI